MYVGVGDMETLYFPLNFAVGFFFFLFRATPVACGISQARGRIRAASETYPIACGNPRSLSH